MQCVSQIAWEFHLHQYWQVIIYIYTNISFASALQMKYWPHTVYTRISVCIFGLKK